MSLCGVEERIFSPECDLRGRERRKRELKKDENNGCNLKQTSVFDFFPQRLTARNEKIWKELRQKHQLLRAVKSRVGSVKLPQMTTEVFSIKCYVNTLNYCWIGG